MFLEGLNPRIKSNKLAIFGTLTEYIPYSSYVEGKEVYIIGTSFITGIIAGLIRTLL